MPRFDKWLTGVAADTPADEAARRAIATRLRAVSHYLELATAGHHEAEAVHQLRIWTRRAAAALRFFRPAVDRRQCVWMRKTLRKLRRTAGKVRDCDVHLERLELNGKAPPKQVRSDLIRQRRRARKSLRRLHRRLTRHDRLKRRAADLAQAIVWPKRHSNRTAPPFAAWCRQQLDPLAAEFFNLANADLSEIDTIHELRIAGKRVRYALELTAAVMNAKAHAALYDHSSEIQDRLGEICDHSAVIDHLRRWRKEACKKATRRKLKLLVRAELTEMNKLQARLLRWWTPARRQRLAAQWRKAVSNL